MANVVRLVNGGSIQVRTGVIQGIGPEGPKGGAGPQGPQGEQGIQGVQGEMGQINAIMGRTNVAANNPITANTDTTISFGSVAFDDLSCFISTTNTQFGQAGDYMLSTYLRFDDAAAGLREVWFLSSSAIIARASRQSVAGAPFFIDLTFPFRAAQNSIVTVLVRSAAATGVSLGSLAVNRLGSGPVGPQGPQGPVGTQGIQGIQGPAGPPGTANAGFAKYADMMPH